MSYAAAALRQTTRRLLIIQSLLILATAIAYLVVKGGEHFVAALFGGGIALLNTLVSAQRLRRATEAAAQSANRGLAEMYIGAAVRFVATPLLVAVGIAAFGLEPVAIIVGFAVAQVGYFFNSAHPHGPKPNS